MSSNSSGILEEETQMIYRKWPSIFIHGGSSVNTRGKKTYLADLWHINTETGTVRKFFLFDSAKARENHVMVKAAKDEILYVYGGSGQKGNFDDLWSFDLENVAWNESKQADLVGAVVEK
jgi:triacylglycerol esterase/lipase EstA (alpha/beta hydrolase family)